MTDPVVEYLELKPRAVDYAHLVGRYVRMERAPASDEERALIGDADTIGMECVVAQVNDLDVGVEIVADYGYGFIITSRDADDWCWHVWPDKETRELFATRAPMGVRHGESIPASVKAELAEIENTLARALGYTYDPNYGYAVGDHTPFTLAQAAASRLTELTESLRLCEQLRTSGTIGED